MHDNTVAGYTGRVRTLDCWHLPAASCAMHIHLPETTRVRSGGRRSAIPLILGD